MIVFILDALCNGTNGLIQVQERIVLPRTHDVVTDILDLLEPLEPPYEIIGKMNWGFELLVVDFSDAVLSILVNEKREDALWSRTVNANGSHTEASRLALCRGR